MNKRELGAQYRIKILCLLAVLGYATTRQLAKATWNRCDESTKKMAGRTLRWLQRNRLIVSKRDGEGVNKVNNELLFALTALGAEEARRNGSKLVADKVHARDYLRHAHGHRTACNSVYAAVQAPAWSELQIRAGAGPFGQFKYRLEGQGVAKIPDLVVAVGDRYVWIEVENSWRSDKDLTKVVECMREMFTRVPDRISCMHFVVTVEGAKTIGKRLRQKLTHGPESGWSAPVRQLDARILAEHLKVSMLDPEALTLREMAF